MKIEKISIRGRVAYGILCLETLIRHLRYDISKWDLILNKLWSFTNSNIGRWHEIMSEMTPFSILEKKPFIEKGCEFISETTHNDLQVLYENSNKDILLIIDLIFEIGTKDLYSSISNNSQETVQNLNCIISTLQKNNVKLPNEELFINLSILENEGWGIEFTRNELINENIRPFQGKNR